MTTHKATTTTAAPTYQYPLQLAPYACTPTNSNGRYVAEPDDPIRSCYQRDRDRILHSHAFRRLKHKTQVFVAVQGDHYRTRLTHSLEVAQIARTLGRALRLNEDLLEAMALAHDLGHPPFGHAGEEALDAAIKEVAPESSGFDHNVQTVRLLTVLENRYAKFTGLNLTWETLSGTIKHNGPITREQTPKFFQRIDDKWNLKLGEWASLEAQIASLADDIAYTAHDMDDGLRAGLLSAEQLAELPVFGEQFAAVSKRYAAADQLQQVHQAVRRVIRVLVMDVLEETSKRLATLQPATLHDITTATTATAAFSTEVGDALNTAKKFLFETVYHHPTVRGHAEYGQQVIHQLFAQYTAEPQALPDSITATNAPLPRQVADFIAGMTDQYALAQYEAL